MTASTVWLRGDPVELGRSVAEHVDDGTLSDVPTRLREMVQRLSRRTPPNCPSPTAGV